MSVGLIAARHTLHQTASMGEQIVGLLLSPCLGESCAEQGRAILQVQHIC